MSSPDLEPLDDDLRALFAAERSRPEPPRLVRARVLAQVNATLSPGGGGGGGGGGRGAAGATGGALLKPILLGLALGVVVVAAVSIREAMAPTPAPRPIAAAIEPPASALPSARAPTLEPPAPSASAAPPRPSTEASAIAHHDESLAAERELLDEANRALASGRSDATFAALIRHAEEFPRGRLSEEREGLWLRALLGAGRTEEARTRAARFKQIYPRSMLLPALESTLGTIP